MSKYIVGVILSCVCVEAFYLKQIGSSGTPRQVDAHRLFCPLNTLDACQTPQAMLTSDAMKPCYRNSSSGSMGVVAPGGSLDLHWLNVNDTSVADSAVSLSIAPFALDPPMNSVTCFTHCATSYINNGTTTGSIAVPADVTDGMYTLMWLWKYGSNWYSSCADFQVVTSTYETGGCASMASADLFCQKSFGPGSYCKSWTRDNCGRSYCLGGDLQTDCASTTRPVTSATTTKPTTSTTTKSSPSTTVAPTTKVSTVTTTSKSATTIAPTTKPSTVSTTTKTTAPQNTAPTGLAVYTINGCGQLSPSFCATFFGTGSYCKTWSLDSCGRAVCQGTSEILRLANKSC